MAGTAHPEGEGHGSAAVAWVSVLLMVIGFTLCVLALPIHSARVPLLVVGVVVGLAGVVLGKVTGIMERVE